MVEPWSSQGNEAAHASGDVIDDAISSAKLRQRFSVTAKSEWDDDPLADPDKVFLDAEEMRVAVRESLRKPVYDVKNSYKEEGVWSTIARSVIFDNLTLFVIVLNAVWIAVDTDNNAAPSLLEASEIFQIAEHGFCVYFSFEWFVRFMAFKRKRDGFKDYWFVFDTSLVFMMVMETWVMTIALFIFGAGLSAGGAASLLRLLRLLRLSRLARMLRSMPELMILIRGMVASTRSVFFTLCLLIILMYIFAILLKQLTEDTRVGNIYFPSIPESMYTLLVSGTFLDNLTVVIDDLGRDSYLFAGIFFTFILLGALTVMNMLIGVLCEVVSAVSDAEREESTVQYVKSKMGKIMDQLDENGDQKISKEEFGKIMENVDAICALQEVGVDPVGLVDFADYIFEQDPEVFLPGEPVIDYQGRMGTVVSGPHGKVYKVQFDTQSLVVGTKDVKKNKLFKMIKPGDAVSVEGRDGILESGPDAWGRYKVVFRDGDGEVVDSVTALRRDIEKASDVELSQEDFLEVVLKFRGCNTATIKDMVDVQKFITTRASALEEKLRVLERSQRHNQALCDSRPSSALALPSRPSTREDTRKDVEQGTHLFSMVGGLMGLLELLLKDLHVFETTWAQDSSGSRQCLAIDCAVRSHEAGCRPLRSLASLHTLDLDSIAARQQERDGHGFDAEGQSLEQAFSRPDIEQQLRRLEDQGASILEEACRIRTALQSGLVGRGGWHHDATAGAIVAGVASGSLAASAPELRVLRVLLARLETLFLTSWVDELQRALRSLQHCNGAPLPPLCDVLGAESGYGLLQPFGSHSGEAVEQCEHMEESSPAASLHVDPCSTSLLVLLQERHSELRDLLRRMPCSQSEGSG